MMEGLVLPCPALVGLNIYDFANTVCHLGVELKESRDADQDSEMAAIGGNLGYRILRYISPGDRPLPTTVDIYQSPDHKLSTHFGARFFDSIRGRTVVDFGSGRGMEAIEIAKRGARRVIGVELQERFREEATRNAVKHGVSETCMFVPELMDQADVVFSLDSFEHFADPGGNLRLMSEMVADGGEIWISFGLPWYHPHGGHLFSVFPWSHLVFTEEALLRWRADFKDDGATRFCEVAGGLNQMTIARFQQLVAESPLEFLEFRMTPISKLRLLHCRATREFTTSLIFARLGKSTMIADQACNACSTPLSASTSG